MKAKKSTPEMGELLMSDQTNPNELRRAIDLLAADRVFQYEPRFAVLLNHQDLDVRSQALQSLLVIWQKDEYLQVALAWLGEGGMNAFCAADVLEGYLTVTARHRDEVLRALARYCERTTEEETASEAYRTFLRALGREDLAKQVGPDWDRDRDLDWELLRPYLAS